MRRLMCVRGLEEQLLGSLCCGTTENNYCGVFKRRAGPRRHARRTSPPTGFGESFLRNNEVWFAAF